MWALDNRTPFAADRSWVRDRDGAEIWLVAVKGTFGINADGSTYIAEDQEPVNIMAKYSGEPGKSSVLYDTDVPRTKVTTDIIVNGHAYAPDGKSAKTVNVSLRVGQLAKSLRITGDRKWHGFGLFAWRGRSQPFIKMPITYERAYGGMDLSAKNPKRHKWDLRNPVGTGFCTQGSHLIGRASPNIQLPGSIPLSWLRRPRPAGFGVIDAHWMPRVKLAGKCDAKWQNERAPLLPKDFDDRFYQSAPSDQQSSKFLEGEEEVSLSNLTPNGSLRFKLPRIILGFETDFGSERVRHRANLHSVILEPDVPRLIMVWHTALRCHPKVTKLRSTKISQKTLLTRTSTGFSDAEAESGEVVA